MINLLPNEAQKEIKSRRINLILFKYLIVLSVSVAFLIVASLSTNIFLNIAKNSANQSSPVSDTGSSKSNLNELKIQNSSTILSQQVSYSRLLQNLSEILPKGVMLNKININKTSIESSTVAEFIVSQDITLEKLKTDLENSSLINSATLSQLEDETEIKVNALLSINSEGLR